MTGSVSKPPHVDNPPRPAALEVQGLCRSFADQVALHDVNFTVPEGSLTVLLGPAGAGKTTALRTVAGLDRPDAGGIVMRGREVTSLQPKDRDIAMIFDNLALYPNRTGFANIANPLRVKGADSNEIKRRVAEVSSTLRIAHVLNRLPKTMSGGERQRIALGRALIRKPGLFLLDEPLSSLDAMLRIELRVELKRLQRESGATFLLATPDFAEALAVADHVIMLRSGRVVQIATAQALYDAPFDREVARFVGAPQINLLCAEYDHADRGTIHVAGASIRGLQKLQSTLPPSTRTFELGIRPEQLRMVSPTDAAIRAQIYDIEPLGLKSMLTVKNDSSELRLVVSANTAGDLAVGETVGIDVIDDGLLAFDASSGLRFRMIQANEPAPK